MEHEINKEFIKIQHHGLDNHLRQVMLKLHKHLMKIYSQHNLHCQKNLQ